MDMVDIFPNAAFQYDDSLTASQNAFWDLSCPAVDESLGQDQKTFSDTSQCSDDVGVLPWSFSCRSPHISFRYEG